MMSPAPPMMAPSPPLRSSTLRAMVFITPNTTRPSPPLSSQRMRLTVFRSSTCGPFKRIRQSPSLRRMTDCVTVVLLAEMLIPSPFDTICRPVSVDPIVALKVAMPVPNPVTRPPWMRTLLAAPSIMMPTSPPTPSPVMVRPPRLSFTPLATNRPLPVHTVVVTGSAAVSVRSVTTRFPQAQGTTPPHGGALGEAHTDVVMVTSPSPAMSRVDRCRRRMSTSNRANRATTVGESQWHHLGPTAERHQDGAGGLPESSATSRNELHTALALIPRVEVVVAAHTPYSRCRNSRVIPAQSVRHAGALAWPVSISPMQGDGGRAPPI